MPSTSYDPTPDASSTRDGRLSAPGALLRRRDPDRFFTALFAPPDRREALFALYAFDSELARARAVTQEPTIALLRLAWWREMVAGAARAHEIATPLGAALDAGRLDRADLLAAIAAREAEATDELPTLEAWRDYLLGSAGSIAVAAGRLLGAPDPEALRPLGAACGTATVLRGIATLARRGRTLLPATLREGRGLSLDDLARTPPEPAVQALRRSLAAEGRAWLALPSSTRLPRHALAAALPSVLARRDLRDRHAALPRSRSLADRLAVLLAVTRGRV